MSSAATIGTGEAASIPGGGEAPLSIVVSTGPWLSSFKRILPVFRFNQQNPRDRPQRSLAAGVNGASRKADTNAIPDVAPAITATLPSSFATVIHSRSVVHRADAAIGSLCHSDLRRQTILDGTRPTSVEPLNEPLASLFTRDIWRSYVAERWRHFAVVSKP
jgi:hypothetical protein